MGNEDILNLISESPSFINHTTSVVLGHNNYDREKKINNLANRILELLKRKRRVDIAEMMKELGESVDIILEALRKLKTEGKIIENA